jgi:Histidine kinase
VSFAGVIVAYSLGAHVPGRESIVAVGVLLLGYLADQLLISRLSPGLVPGGILLLGFPWLAGRALSSHRLLTGELRVRTAQLEREREERARLAVLQERSRLAVAINDVVSRGIAAMVSQADAGRAAFGGERVAVEEALHQMEHDGRAALAEMRRLLGALRTDDSQALAPQPSLAEVDRLVDNARGSGMDVGLSVEGDPRRLPTGVDVSAYRIVQEALRNAREQRDASILCARSCRRLASRRRANRAGAELLGPVDGRPRPRPDHGSRSQDQSSSQSPARDPASVDLQDEHKNGREGEKATDYN